MRKKIFNFFVQNRLEKFIVIALFLVVADATPAYSATLAQDSGAIPFAIPTSTAPVWAKLVVVGNTVTCYYATGTATPTAWTKMGATQTVNFINNPILVGMYISSHDNTTVATGTIDKFSITPAPVYRLADADIGSPPLMGSANLIGGVWNLTGSGADIWGSTDQLNFQSWLVWGDFTVVCRVTSMTGASPWLKMGIMVRDGFNSGSDYASFCLTNGHGIDFQYRLAFNNNPDIVQFVAPPAPGVKSSVAVGYGLTGGTTYTLRP